MSLPRAARALVALAALTTSACRSEPASGPRIDEAAIAKRGAEALAPLKKNLMGALKSALAVSPVAAVEACQIAAPGLPAAASTASVTVGRTTDKLRSPQNAAKPWLLPLLADYAKAGPSAAPRAVSIDAKTAGYVEPIYLQPMCLTCHGPSIAPDVAEALSARYPNDQAKGYAEGDFRGLFWVEMTQQ
jgi:hypothetical protein